MEVYYDKSELENDKTYQFIRDLDLPAEPNSTEEESPYKLLNNYNKFTKRRRNTRWNTDQAEVSHQSIKTVHLASNSPQYFDIDTGENLTISQYSQHGIQVNNYTDPDKLHLNSRCNQQPARSSDSTKTLASSEYNQQHAKNCDTSDTRASSQYNQLNKSVYYSDYAGEDYAASRNNLGDVRSFHTVDSDKNLAVSEYSLCDVRDDETYINNTVNALETQKHNQAVSAVWDVIDPHGKVRGLPASVPETPIFSTGIVTPNKDSIQSSVPPKTDSYQKRIIRHSKLVLYSPEKCDIMKPEVDRPAGCKTLLIFGIPEKMDKNMVNDVFRKCGKIKRIRMRTNGCYITFACVSSVDNALKLSGYQVVVRDRREAPYCGRIHIDFVPVREEQLQYERAKQKERDAMKDHGPLQSLLPHFSEATATSVVDQLRTEDSLDVGVKSLIKWMKEGKCDKNNAAIFFSVLQAMQGFISRLMKDTAKIEEEVHQHQCRLNGKYAANSLHFVSLLKAFDIATSKKVWDNFSKTQRTRIDQWKKHIEEIKESNSQDLISSRVEEKMDLSDDDGSSVNQQQGDELKRLQAENEHLKNELKSVKGERLGLKQKDIFVNCGEIEKNKKAPTVINGQFSNHVSSDNVDISAKEARLIALVGAFLNFHRFGEHIDAISKYVLKIDSSFTIEDIQSLLRKFPTVFIESFQEKKWTFLEQT